MDKIAVLIPCYNNSRRVDIVFCQSYGLLVLAEMPIQTPHRTQLSGLRHTALSSCPVPRTRVRGIRLQLLSCIRPALRPAVCRGVADAARDGEGKVGRCDRKPLRGMVLRRHVLHLARGKKHIGDMKPAVA